MSTKIVLGIDGSDKASRAVAWCASHAQALDAEVVAVHAIDVPIIVTPMTSSVPLPQFSEIDRDQLREVATTKWCAPLAAAGVPFRVVLRDDSPAVAIMETAEAEDADLVVVGRRGRGGFAELVLGSTSYALIHHLPRPLVIVP
jgi:nucleotide-binding universal stress UspA family protein